MCFWDWFCDNILGDWWYDGGGLLVVMLLIGALPYFAYIICGGTEGPAANLDENGRLETVDNRAATIEETKVPAIVAQAKPRPLEPQPDIQKINRPLLATQVDSASGRMTVEMSDGMKAVFVVALVMCCLVLVAGYWVTVYLVKSDKEGGI